MKKSSKKVSKIAINGWLVDESAKTVVFRLKHSGNEYFGVARCNPSDKWDEEKGKKIARLRATKLALENNITEMMIMRNEIARAANRLIGNEIVNQKSGAFKKAYSVVDDLRIDISVMKMKLHQVKYDIKKLLD